MQTIFTAVGWNDRRIPLGLLFSAFVMLVSGLSAEAAAPSRATPYVESICKTSPDVFFCEDFEGKDIYITGRVGDSQNKWGNPAIERQDLYWSLGGTHQRSTAPLPGFNQATNRVWRITKTKPFTDIDTGLNTGTGSGLLSGWLKASILGSGAREWYTRMQVYLSTDHSFPDDYDFKMFYALPRQFVDPPSAAYETGMSFGQDFWCPPPLNRNFNDVPVVRFREPFHAYPITVDQGKYCPPLAPGQPADGSHAPRIQKNRWYTLEYHIKLAQDSTGILELWVDGNRAYRFNGPTCPGWSCPDVGFIQILGWMNQADSQTGYAEYDNVVMSRRYIGPPGGTAPPDTMPPARPTNLVATPQ